VIRVIKAIPKELVALRFDLYLGVAQFGDRRITTFLISRLREECGTMAGLRQLGVPVPDHVLYRKIRWLTGIRASEKWLDEVEAWLEKNRSQLKNQIPP
jgi:hypothetical protein